MPATTLPPSTPLVLRTNDDVRRLFRDVVVTAFDKHWASVQHSAEPPNMAALLNCALALGVVTMGFATPTVTPEYRRRILMQVYVAEIRRTFGQVAVDGFTWAMGNKLTPQRARECFLRGGVAANAAA